MGDYSQSPAAVNSINSARAILYCTFDRSNDWQRVDATSLFQLNALLRKEIINQGIVENHNKSERGNYAEKNFMTCLKSKKEAVIAEYSDDQFHVESKHCQSRYCFTCADNRARREVRDHASYLSAIAEKFYCESVYQITFSFPEKLAATLHKKPDIENKARTKMRHLIHKFMLPYPNVKKMKVPLHESRHMVGAKNLMKIRLHYHYIVLCGVCLIILNKENKEYLINNNTLSGIIPQRALEKINAQWQKFLRKIYKKNFSPSLRVHVKNYFLNGTKKDKESTIRSLLNYTARAFGREFFEAPKYISSKEDMVQILSMSGSNHQENLQQVSVHDYIRQWKLVRNARKVACAGLMYSKKQVGKVLGIECIQEEMKAELIDYEEAEVLTTHQHGDNGKLSTQKEVFIKTSEGQLLSLPSGTFQFGMRGKVKCWAPTPT